MEQRYLIDTNVIIDAQMNKLPKNGMSFLENILNNDFTVSFITYIEFLGYKNITAESREFILLANVLQINNVIIDICINLRKSSSIKLPDAIIAATAISSDYILVTNNDKDFKSIHELKCLNPHKL